MPARTVEIAFVGSTAQLEAALTRAGLVAKESGTAIGDSFDKGTTRAGNALQKLGQAGANFGVPFAGHLTVIGDRFEHADTKGQKFATTMGTLGGATLLGAGAAIAGVSVEAIKLGVSFDKSMASIAGSAGIPIAAARRIGQAFLDTAGKSVFSGNEMAAAFAPVAGQLKLTEGHALDAAQSLRFMTAAGDLAEASQTSLTGSSAALASVMQSFHLRTTQAAQAGDLLFNVSRAMNVPITTVAGAIDKLHGRLGILMPSMRDVGGLMIALGQHGITGARGVQVVQTALTTLTAGSKASTAMLQELGVNVFNSQGRFIGMAGVIDQLRPKLAGLTQQSQEVALKALFGSSAWQVMGQVIGAGVPKFQAATDAAQKLGTAHQAASLQAHTLGGEARTLAATLTDLGTKIGMVVIPFLQRMGTDLSNTITWMEKHKAVAEALAVVIGSVLGTAVLVFAEQKAVKFGKSVQGMIGDLQKLGRWITGTTAPQLNQLGSTAETSANNVGDAAGRSSAAVASEAASVQGSAAEIDAALTGTGTSATEATATIATATAGTESAVATEAADVTTADSTIEADNAAAGASFTSLLGPIAAAVAAIEGYNALAGNPNADTAKAGSALSGAAKGAGAGGLTAAQLKNLEIAIGGPTGADQQTIGRREPWADQLSSVMKTLTTDLQTFAKTGQKSAFAPYTAAVAALEKAYPTMEQQTGAVKELTAVMNKAIAQGAANKKQAATTSGSLTSQAGWSTALLKSIGAPVNANTLAALTDWSNAEKQWGSGPDYNNPLDVTMGFGQPHGPPTNSAGVFAFNTPQAGLLGTAAFIKNRTPGIIAALRSGNLAQIQAAINATGWTGTKTGYGSGWGAATPNTTPVGQPGSNLGQPGTTLPTGTRTLPSTAKPVATSYHYDWETGSYRQMTEAEYKALQASWYALHPNEHMPASSTSHATTKAAAAQKAAQRTATSAQNSVASTGMMFERATERYQGLAKNATSPELKHVDEHTLAQIVALHDRFASGARGLTGQPLKELTDATKAQLTKIEALATAQTKTIEIFTSVRDELGKAADKYKAASQSATTPLIARLDEHFASLIAELEKGFHTPAQEHQVRQQLQTIQRQAGVDVTLAGRGGTLLSRMESATAATSYRALVTNTDKAHREILAQLVKELRATHQAALENLANQLESTFKVEERSKNDILTADNRTLQAAMTSKITATMLDTSNRMVTAIKDAAQTITDSFSATAKAISDTAQAASDAASAQATQTSDAAQTTVDTLGERGLYGLNLVAQQQQVVGDQMKTTFDQQISAAQQAVDAAQQSGDSAAATQTAIVDAVTAQQNVIVGKAQANLDQVTATQNQLVAQAQNAVDQGKAGSAAALKVAQGTASLAEAQAQQALTSAQNAANQAEAQASSALANANGQAGVVIAQAQSALAQANDQAQVAEAQNAATVAIIKEQAQTQYAGSGLVINIEGVAPTDAAAVASAVGWTLRTQIPA